MLEGKQDAQNDVPKTPLALPSPEEGVTQLRMDQTIKLDALGPMVVNSNGTLSRIANWGEMTEPERERTMRVLAARNRTRLAEQREKLAAEGTEEGAQKE